MTTAVPTPAAGELPEVDLPEGALVLGDVHLDLSSAAAVEAFAGWLRSVDAPALVILGDLFEYWIGAAHARTEGGRRVLAAFAARAAAGTTLHVVPGNRDFLLDEEFARAARARLHPRGLVARTGPGGRAAVIHGDELCTRDRAYQRLRRVLRSAPVRALARGLPRPAADALARRLRGASRRAVAAKPAPEKALQESACRAWAAALGCDTLVCGHAHEHRDEALPGGPRWLVVDAFGGPLDAVRVVPGGRLEPGSTGARAPAGAGGGGQDA